MLDVWHFVCGPVQHSQTPGVQLFSVQPRVAPETLQTRDAQSPTSTEARVCHAVPSLLASFPASVPLLLPLDFFFHMLCSDDNQANNDELVDNFFEASNVRETFSKGRGGTMPPASAMQSMKLTSSRLLLTTCTSFLVKFIPFVPTETSMMRYLRQRRFFSDEFYAATSYATPPSPFIRILKRQCSSSRRLKNVRKQCRQDDKQLLLQKLHLPERLQILSRNSHNRLFTTLTKTDYKTESRRRKKKLSLPNKKCTTKDRLRLSPRPSTNRRQNENTTGMERILIKSPEELVERINSGVLIVRAAVREGYASLRNPEAATSSNKNHGNNNKGPFLSARPASSGPDLSNRKGLTMDANWWFWNLVLAASPAIVITLYCEFIVKPEMKFRNEEKSKDGAHNDEIDVQRSNNAATKLSPIQRRNEQNMQHDVINSISSHPLSGKSDFYERLSSFIQSPLSWLSEKQSQSASSSEWSFNYKKGTTEVKESNANISPIPNQEQLQEGGTRVAREQQKLEELQSQLQILRNEIDCLQKRDRLKGRGDYEGDGVVSESSISRDSIFSLIGKVPRATAGMARDRCISLLSWWQSRRFRWQSSDKSGCDTDGNSDVTPTNAKAITHGSEEKIEKKHNGDTSTE